MNKYSNVSKNLPLDKEMTKVAIVKINIKNIIILTNSIPLSKRFNCLKKEMAESQG